MVCYNISVKIKNHKESAYAKEKALAVDDAGF